MEPRLCRGIWELEDQGVGGAARFNVVSWNHIALTLQNLISKP